jgi:uncharacterized integral membrane protein
MNTLWLKIRIWTKGILIALIAIYALFFIVHNSGRPVSIWVFFFQEELRMPILLVILLTLTLGVVGTLLVRTTLRTLRQIREVRERGRSERLEREIADMRAKAARLQSQPEKPPEQPPAD